MNKPICASAVPEVVAKALKPLLDFQDPGMSLDNLANLIDKCLIPYFVDYGHPGFHSLYNFFLEDGAKQGAETALAYNQGVTNWQVSPGAVMLEEMCCQTLCRLFDLPLSADATFMYSGTYANQQAIYLALHQKAEQNGFDFAEKGLLGFDNPDQLVLVASEEAHFSLRQTLRMMGLGEKSLIGVKADENRRMDVDDLKKYLYERVINERERLSRSDFKIIH
jgi:L-2,4-diaminobutyrate decarboxylase